MWMMVVLLRNGRISLYDQHYYVVVGGGGGGGDSGGRVDTHHV